MTVKTYQAYTMAEALAGVKHDLGAEAVILHTRTFKRGGVLGLGRKTIVEVTATPSEALALTRRRSDGTLPNRKAAGGNGHVLERRDSAGAAEASVPHAGRKHASAVLSARRRRSPLNAATMEAKVPSGVDAADLIGPAERPLVFKPIDNVNEREGAPVAPRGVNQPQSLGASLPPLNQSAARGARRANGTGMMESELAAIKTMVGQVLQRQVKSTTRARTSMPPRLFEMYLQLIGQDVSDELADQIIQQIEEELSGGEGGSDEAIREAARRQLAAMVMVACEPVNQPPADGRPLTIALVGPTGVGKTTTVAKLAATFKLRDSMKVGLITADTYRIAAVDQLRTYAEIIGLPLQVAVTPAEMKHAVSVQSECDVVLIDTAGRSQNDTGRLDELKRYIAAANPHEVHLVLSSTAGEKVLLGEAEAFVPIGVQKIVLTKLDEAASFGTLINVLKQIGKPLSYVTTGQEVPAHLEVGRAERLAELVLGGALQS